jgi:hypothetical protein
MAQSLNPSFKKLTAIDIVNMSDLFKQHLTATDEGAVYEEGWSDQRVANEAIPNYSGNGLATVGKYRITLGYGKLACIKKVSSEYEDLQGQIFRLCGAVASKLDELEIRILYLEGLLAAKDKAA